MKRIGIATLMSLLTTASFAAAPASDCSQYQMLILAAQQKVQLLQSPPAVQKSNVQTKLANAQQNLADMNQKYTDCMQKNRN